MLGFVDNDNRCLWNSFFGFMGLVLLIIGFWFISRGMGEQTNYGTFLIIGGILILFAFLCCVLLILSSRIYLCDKDYFLEQKKKYEVE